MPTRRSFLVSTVLALTAPPLLRADDARWGSEVEGRGRDLEAPSLTPLLVDSAGRPITTLDGWLKRRAEIHTWWLDFLRPLRVARPAIHIEVLREDRDDGVIRQLIRYENGPGGFLEAYLLKPLDAAGRLPGVIVLHSARDEAIRQGAGLGREPGKGFGLQMARRGCVAICPPNFLWTGPKNDKGKYDWEATPPPC